MTPDFREMYDMGFTDAFVRPFEELFFAVNAGTQGRDRIYELEFGTDADSSILSILINNLDAAGILQIEGGGTGATTAAGARTNLGLEIGTDVLAYNANLQAFVNVFDFPIADGTAGQVLGTDGAGNLDFVDVKPIESMIVACSDETTELTIGAGKVTFRMPYAFQLTEVPRASLTTAQSAGGLVTVDINKNGTSIFSTRITIDNTEKTSKTALSQPALSSSPTTFADDDEVSVDIDYVETSGGAAGLKVMLIGQQT